VFTVVGVRADGTEAPVSGQFWQLVDRRLGSIDPVSGAFVSATSRGGTSAVTVEVLGQRAMASLSVRLERGVPGPGLTPTVQGMFAGPDVVDPPRQPRLVYPESGTVFPRNVRAPHPMWDGPGAAGDLYELSVEGPYAALRFWLAHTGAPFKHDLALADADWRSLAESNVGGALTLKLRRLDAMTGQIYASAPVDVRIADTDFRGVIYYWALNLGKIVRLRPDSTAPEDFMTPPSNPNSGNPDHVRCVACHTISRDGRKLAFEYWGGNEWAGVIDVTQPATPVIAPSVARGNFQTFSPDGTRLVLNYGQGLKLHNATTGAEVAGAGLPAAKAAHPIWSPSGSAVAYAAGIMQNANTAASWEIDFGRSDLAIAPYLGFDRFGPAQVLVPGAGRANFYPTYDPTSAIIVYNRSDWSRSDNGPVQPSTAELWMVPAAGGTPTELRKANTGGRSWLPTFSPFSGGGYHWLAFFSRRDYGNAQAGTKGTGRRQIWVAAVNENAAPGTDPSHAGFWLPAQDMTTENMSAYWAPEACMPNGALGCSSDVECCGGQCMIAPGASSGMCLQAPPVCRPRGTSCTQSADCCDGLQCTNGFCGTIG
jgi:hypothetical protein